LFHGTYGPPSIDPRNCSFGQNTTEMVALFAITQYYKIRIFLNIKICPMRILLEKRYPRKENHRKIFLSRKTRKVKNLKKIGTLAFKFVKKRKNKLFVRI